MNIGPFEIDLRIRYGDEIRHHDELILVPRLGLITEQTKDRPPIKVAPDPKGQARIETPACKTKGRLLMAFTLSDSEQTTMTITATDKKGAVVPLPAGAVTWAVDQASLLGLTPAADGASCLVMASGPLGTATVSVKVAGPDGATLAAGSIDVTITGGAASVIKINPGTPTEQP